MAAKSTSDERVVRLEQENAELRAELDAALAGKPAKPVAPTEPSFGLSEGTRDELDRMGKATSPFTGKSLTRADLSPDDEEQVVEDGSDEGDEVTEAAPDYNTWTVAEIVSDINERNERRAEAGMEALSTKGSKAELVARLEDDDAAAE